MSSPNLTHSFAIANRCLVVWGPPEGSHRKARGDPTGKKSDETTAMAQTLAERIAAAAAIPRAPNVRGWNAGGAGFTGR